MESILRYMSTKTKFGMAGGILSIILVLNLLVGWYWSQEPKALNVREVAEKRAIDYGIENYKKISGFVTTSTTLLLGETLLNKPGGYLSNDMTPPSIFLDNLPAWEFGVLVQLRDFTEAMREDLSRSQSQSTENIYLAKAEPKLKFDNSSWMFPETESEYTDALEQLEFYLMALSDVKGEDSEQGNKPSKSRVPSQFYARADNLKNWLDHASKRLGSISQRLSASVGQRVIYFDGDKSSENNTGSLLLPNEQKKETENQTPWLEIDDVFYEARGSTWAMLHLLKAIEIDFKNVLDKKAATTSLQQIIRELEATQERVWSPMILNGKGMGLLANHSLVMANYVSRANAAIIDLKNLLEQG